jgi:hypothetical protein
MTCRTASGGGCGHEFCWVCGHEWTSHKGNAYGCNRFVDFDATPRERIPEGDLMRMHHYFMRYQGHKASQAAEEGARVQIRAELIAAFTSSPIQPTSMENAEALADEIFNAVDTARSVLIWSYPHAFFMQHGSTALRLFEHVQAEVERFLEDLTDKVEHKRDLPPSEFRTSARILANNTELLNRHVDPFSA